MTPGRLNHYLALVYLATIVSIAAGSPLQVPAAGRTVPLGPADLLIFVLFATMPLWFRRLPPPSTFVICALLFAIWAWVGAVFWSIDFRRSVLNAKALLEAAIVYLAGWHVAQGGETKAFPRMFRIMHAVLAFEIVIAVGALLAGPAKHFFVLKNMVNLPLGGSNFLALFLEFGLLYELMSRRKWWLVFAAIDLVGIVLTFSRGALLATAIMLGVMSLVVTGIKGQRKVSLLVLGTLGLGALALVTIPALRGLVDAFSIINRTAGSRIEIWQDAWQAAAWRPLTGIGYGAYESIGTVRDAHSLPLALLAETGIVGLALFTLALAAAMGRVLRKALDARTGERRAEAMGVAAGLAVVLLHALIEPFFLGYSLVWAAGVMAWIMGPWGPEPNETVPAAAAAPAPLATPT